MITSKNYVENVIRSESNDFSEIISRIADEKIVRLLHASMGLCTEVGEFQDMLKKYIFYGKPFDEINAKEELGDIAWYLGVAVDVLKTTLDEILTCNIEKLRVRYPEKFDSEKAIKRNIVNELSVFNKGE